MENDNHKRTRMEIIVDILQVIRNSNRKIKPTHIMYKANLSYKGMEGYLSELLKNKLIKKEEKDEKSDKKEKFVFAITPKGEDFISNYARMKDFEKTFGL